MKVQSPTMQQYAVIVENEVIGWNRYYGRALVRAQRKAQQNPELQ